MLAELGSAQGNFFIADRLHVSNISEVTDSMKHLTQLKSLMVAALTVSLSMGLTACMQGFSVAETAAQAPASDNIPQLALKRVNQTFKTSFMMGDWYYQGATAVKGGIDAYIQIPSELDMDPEYQRNYLRQSVCPKADNQQLWKELSGLSLSVHLYTYNKRFSVHATCENPLVS
jgi:hypothetical protein